MANRNKASCLATKKIDAAGVETNELEVAEISYATEDAFIKLYISQIRKYNSLQGAANSVLAALIENANYSGITFIGKKEKEEIAARNKSSVGSVDVQLTKLVKQEIIIRRDRGIYMLNPYIIARGSWRDVLLLRREFDIEKGKIYKYKGGKE